MRIMDMMKVYHPQYYKKFICDVNECKNNCCSRGWAIAVDPSTYEKYMAVEGDFKNKFDGKLVPLKSSHSQYRIDLDEKGECSFLNEKGLCNIQLDHGFDALCLTCRVYPRRLCHVGDSDEVFMQPSCEVAAKLILFEKGLMTLEDGEAYKGSFLAGDTIQYSHRLELNRYTNHPSGLNIFWKLRSTTIGILQSRQYSMRFRMLILLLFIQECADAMIGGQDGTLIPLADSYVERLFGDYFDELYTSMPQGVDREPAIVLDILKDIHKKQNKNAKLFKEYLSITLEGFDISEENWEVPNNFPEHYAKYYDTFFAANEQLFENYIVHDVLSDGFPFTYARTGNIMQNYAALLAKYNIIEFLLVGASRRKMKFDKRLIVNMVARFCCCYEHTTTGYLLSEE
jgi:lysine-N-methylase